MQSLERASMATLFFFSVLNKPGRSFLGLMFFSLLNEEQLHPMHRLEDVNNHDEFPVFPTSS